MMYLREATEADRVLVLSWRNNPLIWAGTYTQRTPLSWQDHKIWWSSRKDHIMLMVVLIEEDIAREIGVLNISPLSYWSPEIGIIIGEVSLWNKGYGTEAFRLGCRWLKEKGYRYTSTTVLDTNRSAIRMLEKLGFHRTCEAREGESRYAKELNTIGDCPVMGPV